MDKFKNYFMTDEESVKKHSEVAKKMAEDAERLFKNQKTKEKVENEMPESKTEKPLDKRKFQKIQYYKQLIDNLIYTKTNRRLQHENNNKNQTSQKSSKS